MRGHGLPAVGKPDERGDLYANVEVDIPKTLTDEERKHYEALASARVESSKLRAESDVMNLNKFTEKAQEAVVAAPQLASELNHAQVEPEHLLVTLAEQQGGVVPSVLRKLNVDPAEVAKALRDHLAKQPKAHGGAEPHLSPRLRVVLDAAQADAKAMQDEFVSTEHLLLGLLGEPGRSPSRRSAEARAA